MLTGSPAVRVFVARQPQDLRRGFDALAGLVTEHMDASPYSGHWFVFFNRRLDRVKALWWDRNGFALFYKRLEKGRFPVRLQGDGPAFEVQAEELLLVLAGFDLARTRRIPRWSPPASAPTP